MLADCLTQAHIEQEQKAALGHQGLFHRDTHVPSVNFCSRRKCDMAWNVMSGKGSIQGLNGVHLDLDD